MSNFLIILILAFLSGLTTLIGTALAIFFNKRVKLIAVGLGFAAGIMLWISIFELVPESFNAVGLAKSAASFAIGILIIVLLNLIIPHHHHRQEKGKLKTRLLKTGYLCALGLIMHDLPEGFAMASSFLRSPQLGIVVALAIALHNIPEEFAIAVPFVLAKKESSLLFKVALMSGLAEPAGAVIGILAASAMPQLTPILLSFAAGAMVFISLHELIPTARIYKKDTQLLLGGFFSLVVYLGMKILLP